MGVTAGFAHTETPPEDDVCPICFGDFVLPCRSNCGHWFCGACILELWNFTSAFQACKCPICTSRIKTLDPAGSFPQLENEEEAKEVLNSIKRYNRLFVGGASGFFMKFYGLPLLLRRMFSQMIDPDQVDRHVLAWRLLAILLGFLYTISPLNFIPKGVNVMALCNIAAQLIVYVIKIIGLLQRRRTAERERRLAAVEDIPAGS